MKKTLYYVVFWGVIWLLPTFPAVARAESETTKIIIPSSATYSYVKAKEWVKINLLTFRAPAKARAYDGYSNRRISEIKYALSIRDDNAASQSLSRYEIQKQKALEIAERINDQAVMEKIRERTIEQQRTMTEFQLQLENTSELQENIVRVQKQVAVQIKETVLVVEGEEQAATVDRQTWTVWRDPKADISGNLPPLPDNLVYAPGTAPGGTGGWIYEGGSKQIWAPGTSSGGAATEQKSENIVVPGTPGGGQSGQIIENN